MPAETFSVTIDSSQEGQRIDKVLAVDERVGSRTKAQDLIELNLVLLENSQCAVKPSQLVKLGEVYKIQIPEATHLNLQPLDLELDILFEDSDVIVINKPAGLVVHPSLGHSQDTLVNALLNYTDQLSMGFGEKRPGIVHRLDRDTSGILVVARNEQAHQNLSQQFKDRKTSRTYWAIVVGRPPVSHGRIESYIARDLQNRKKFTSTDSTGKWAATNFKLLETSNKGVSLLELKLETGRTHQIRVHLSSKGWPVLGDTLYSSRVQRKLGSELTAAVDQSQRFALHATQLGFLHPSTKEWIEFKIGWPSDLHEIVEMCEFKTR